MDRYEVLMLLGLLSLTVNFWLAIWLWSRPVVRKELDGDVVYHPGTGTYVSADECVLIDESDLNNVMDENESKMRTPQT